MKVIREVGRMLRAGYALNAHLLVRTRRNYRPINEMTIAWAPAILRFATRSLELGRPQAADGHV